MEEKIVSSIGGIRKTGQSHAKKKIEVYPHLKPCAKINSKYVKYFSLRPQTIKLLDEKFRFCSLTSVFPIFFKNLITKAQITKTKISK